MLRVEGALLRIAVKYISYSMTWYLIEGGGYDYALRRKYPCSTGLAVMISVKQIYIFIQDGWMVFGY